jgi:glycosyltransferase involved in cell wall biosynthesis
VFFQNSVAVEAFGRSILEAIASRMVVILPRQYEEVFGEAALYAEPKDVQSLVMSYHNDRKLYSKQVARADAVVEQRFSHRSYAELIKALKEEVTA